MANPLPEEAQLYQKIRDENIKVPVEVWDLIYYRVGNALSAVNMTCEYYLQENEPMPVEEAKKLLNYTRAIKIVIDGVLKGKPALHPAIYEMFTHYIPNDVHAINLIICDTIDPIGPMPLPPEYLKKILLYAKSSKAFMNRLREATIS